MNHEPGPTVADRDGAIEVKRFGRAVSAAKLDYCPDLVADLGKLEADVLHIHVPNPTMIISLLASRSKHARVVGYHSDAVRQKLRILLFRPLERMAYHGARAILPTSPLYAQGSSFLKTYANRLRVLPLGVDLEPYINPSAEHVREAEKIRSQFQGPLWLGCGRLVYYKGFVNAIRALSRVPGTLALIGKGPERKSLEDEARRLGVEDRVVFLGGLPSHLDIIPYYMAADAFWFPSNERSEAFGLVQVEAMACSCPVINSKIPGSGVPWVSLHEQTGLTALWTIQSLWQTPPTGS